MFGGFLAGFPQFVRSKRFLAQSLANMAGQRTGCRIMGFIQLFEEEDEGLWLTGEFLDNRKDEPSIQFTRCEPVRQRTNKVLSVFHGEAR